MKVPDPFRTALKVLMVVAIVAGGIVQVSWTVRTITGAIPSHLYWDEPDKVRIVRDVGALKAVLPLMEELQLASYRQNDWCHELWYSGGAYWTDPDCVAYGDPITPFPPEAEQVFERVQKALDASGVWVVSVSAEYGADGHLSWAEFDLNPAPWRFDRWSYLYQTGFPPESMPGEDVFTPIEPNWYYHWGDWM